MTIIKYGAVDNLDNSLSYDSAPKAIKCIYYAFANAQNSTADEIYRTNQNLITDDCNWDDTGMVVKLAHRYSFRLHPAILTIEQLPERFTDPTNELIVVYRKSGLYIPDSFMGRPLSQAEVRGLLMDKAYEKIGFHAIYGTIQRNAQSNGATSVAISYKDQDGNHNPNVKYQCVVFVRPKKT